MPGNPYEKDILTTNRKNTFFFKNSSPPKEHIWETPKSTRIEYLAKTAVCIKLVWTFSRNCLDNFKKLIIFSIDLIWCKIQSLADKFFLAIPEHRSWRWSSLLVRKFLLGKAPFTCFLVNFAWDFFWVEEIGTLDVLRFAGGLIWRILTGLHRFQRFLWFAKQNNWEWLDTPSDFGISKTGEQKHNQADWF